MKINLKETNKNKLMEQFNNLPSVELKEFNGEYVGNYFKTGSLIGPFLKLINWKGKEFISEQNVNALILKCNNKTFKPYLGKAHLEKVNFKNKKSASMKYKFLPIRDHFRKIDDKIILGAMTVFGIKKIILFFYLEKK